MYSAWGPRWPLGAPRTLRFLLSARNVFPFLLFKSVKMYRGMFPKSRAPCFGGIAGIRARRVAVASDGLRLAASTAGLVKVRAISGTLPTGSFPGLPSGQRPQVDYFVALFCLKTKKKTTHCIQITKVAVPPHPLSSLGREEETGK